MSKTKANIIEKQDGNSQFSYVRGISLIIRGSILLFLWFVLATRIWNYPNVFLIDFTGQIASAQFFADYGYHMWNPHWFSGLINNLFYPPLQDTLVWIISQFFGGEMLLSFQIYVIILTGVYFFGFWLISTRWKSVPGILTWAIGVLFILFYNKFPDITQLQGLGIVDLLFTGLITQFLGGAFLLFIIYEILGKGRLWLLVLLSVCSFLSHLVIGPVAILVVFLFTLLQKRKYFLYVFLSTLLLTLFFRGPFLVSKHLMASTNIIHQLPRIFLLVLAILSFFTSYKNRLFPIIIAGVLILLPTEVNTILSALSIEAFTLPNFHYYRFGIVGLLFVIVGISHLVDRVHSGLQKKHHVFFTFCIILILSLSAFLYKDKRGGFWGPMTDVLGKNQPPIHADFKSLENLDSSKRVFTIDAYRPVDFALDSLDQYVGNKNMYAKGLFRESNYTNQVVSSFIASVLSSQNAVLDTYNPGDVSYLAYSRIWNQFVSMYNVGYLVVSPNDLRNRFLSPQRIQNLETFLTTGTDKVKPESIGTIKVNEIEYNIYKLNILDPTFSVNRIRVVNTPFHIIELDPAQQFFSRPLFEFIVSVQNLTSSHKEVLLTKKGDTLPDISPTLGAGVELDIKSPHTYTITLSGAESAWVQINQSYFPGRSYIGVESGKEKVTYEGPLATYVYVDEPVLVTYARPRIFYLFYVISSITFICCCFFLLKYRKKL